MHFYDDFEDPSVEVDFFAAETNMSYELPVLPTEPTEVVL